MMQIADLKGYSLEELQRFIADTDALLFAARVELVSRGTCESGAAASQPLKQVAKAAAVEALQRSVRKSPATIGFALVILLATIGLKFLELFR